MSDVEALRATPIFQGLSEDQIQAILAAVEQRQVPAGTVILNEGGRDDSMYVVASGSVDVAKRLGLTQSDDADAAKKTLIRLEAPQFFGEIGLLDDIERSATISAHTDCVLIELKRTAFTRLVEADLQLGYLVVKNMAIVLGSRLRRTDRDVLKLTAALSLALGNR